MFVRLSTRVVEKSSNTLKMIKSPRSERVSSGSFSFSAMSEDEIDDDSSYASSASYESSQGATTENPNDLRQMIHFADKDTVRVKRWRAVVLLMLIAVGATLATFSYFIVTNQQDWDSNGKHLAIIDPVLGDSVRIQAKMTASSFQNLAETITAASLGRPESDSFPFITVPMYELHSQQTRKKSGASQLIFIPFVAPLQKLDWERYSVQHAEDWLHESYKTAERSLKQTDSDVNSIDSYNNNTTKFAVSNYIFTMNTKNGQKNPSLNQLQYGPVWHISPPPLRPDNMINLDIFSVSEEYNRLARAAYIGGEPIWSSVQNWTSAQRMLLPGITASNIYNRDSSVSPPPVSLYTQPVFSQLNKASDVKGLLIGVFSWELYLEKLLPIDSEFADFIILNNNCGRADVFSWNGTAGRATYLGKEGHLPESPSLFPGDSITVPFDAALLSFQAAMPTEHCMYHSLSVYTSTPESVKVDDGNIAVKVAVVIAVVFFVICLAFCFYDAYVQRRNAKVADAAARSNAIVSSIFPSMIRDRLLDQDDKAAVAHLAGLGAAANGGLNTDAAHMSRLKKYLSNEGMADHVDNADIMFQGKPIADLFPETTIIFADIAGFTAWSSVREPSQVFTLLETVYRAFDNIAKKRRVFKVETVGDCYVAVAGLPDPRKDHAVTMARFSRDCMHKVQVLTKKLELTLGPDTADLSMRMGLHSGPVTAGVLRGERSRFQLFGDTMNTASRMETTSLKGRVQLSQETAALLTAAGKAHWLRPREDKVFAKGKGEMQTYWLQMGALSLDSTGSISTGENIHSSDEDNSSMRSLDQSELRAYALSKGKQARLIRWNADMLKQLLKQIVTHRMAAADSSGEIEFQQKQPDESIYKKGAFAGATVLDEVKEIITLPQFDAAAANSIEDADIELCSVVQDQIHDYVASIAAMYRENPFHDFEHASHVTMSVAKLMSRIVAPSHMGDLEDQPYKQKMASKLHDHTYGITSDPLTQFACVLSALIHDVDHPGVPNAQLVKENNIIAVAYKKKSIAEQNSVDLAWDLLLDDSYAELRQTIYQTDAEMRRFRQLVVNSVMATDIIDKDLKQLRNARWDKAFSDSAPLESEADQLTSINRKATIVIEHLIQASDVAHTMQHWHIYRKWNERFFLECYLAYKNGRSDKDPATYWYDGELGFFDFYIIPLARKLKDCGVFGVSSDEYFNYAIKNREEWEVMGKQVVNEMVEEINTKMSGCSKPVTSA